MAQRLQMEGQVSSGPEQSSSSRLLNCREAVECCSLQGACWPLGTGPGWIAAISLGSNQALPIPACAASSPAAAAAAAAAAACLQDAQPVAGRRPAHVNGAVKAPRAQQRLIQCIDSVGGPNHQHLQASRQQTAGGSQVIEQRGRWLGLVPHRRAGEWKHAWPGPCAPPAVLAIAACSQKHTAAAQIYLPTAQQITAHRSTHDFKHHPAPQPTLSFW
jgi:hypothetical protein